MFYPPFARDDGALWAFPAEERDAIRRLPFNWIRYVWIILKLHVTDPTISLSGTTQHMYDNLERWTDYEISLWDQLDLETASVEEIVETRRRAREASGFSRNTCLAFRWYLPVLQAALRTVLDKWCGDVSHELNNRLVAGLHTKTAEENSALWALSRELRRSAPLMELVQRSDPSAILPALAESDDGRAFARSLDEFISSYGHRGGCRARPDPLPLAAPARVRVPLAGTDAGSERRGGPKAT